MRCVTHLRQQSTHGDSLGGGNKRGGQLWGVGWQNRVKVEAIWWRHLSSTKSPPYLPSVHPKGAKGLAPNLHASLAGVRQGYQYQRHDQLVFLVKNYIGKPYTILHILSRRFCWNYILSVFCIFCGTTKFWKTLCNLLAEFSKKSKWRTDKNK